MQRLPLSQKHAKNPHSSAVPHLQCAETFSNNITGALTYYYKFTVQYGAAFSALTLLAGRQEEHPECKN